MNSTIFCLFVLVNQNCGTTQKIDLSIFKQNMHFFLFFLVLQETHGGSCEPFQKV